MASAFLIASAYRRSEGFETIIDSLNGRILFLKTTLLSGAVWEAV